MQEVPSQAPIQAGLVPHSTTLQPQMVEIVPSEGWGVLHLYFRITGDRREPLNLAAAQAATERFVAHAPNQAIWQAVLGPRADLGLMLIAPDLAIAERLHGELLSSPLGARLEPVPELGFVSLTELSEYSKRDGDDAHMEMLERRLHPQLPTRKLVCFYPMSKRRVGDDNWYSLDFDTRLKLMGGHGRLGAKFREQIVQLITGATGLTDWEWGVTLLADDIKAIKDIVYEMRFDEVSARYGEFGPFTVGIRGTLAESCALAGCHSA